MSLYGNYFVPGAAALLDSLMFCIYYSGHNCTRLKVKEIHYGEELDDTFSLSQSSENDGANYEEMEHHEVMVSYKIVVYTMVEHDIL